MLFTKAFVGLFFHYCFSSIQLRVTVYEYILSTKQIARQLIIKHLTAS